MSATTRRPGGDDGAAQPGKSRKIRRNPRACDACSRRSVRCQPAPNNASSCKNCVDFAERCTFDRPARRRGKQRMVAEPSELQPEISLARPVLTGGGDDATQDSKRGWAPSLTVTQSLSIDLTDIFFESVYPVFPLFHRPSLLRRVSRGEHLASRPLYASVMALCALCSARARDGATLRQSWDSTILSPPSSEQFFAAAADAIPKDLLVDHSLDYMRACILLSITAIQYGSPSLMNYYLSTYHTFVATAALHDEEQWPQGISVIELEERRRLFWSAYTLDVFTSIVWGGVIRSREAASNVSYPAEKDDEALGISSSATDSTSISWLRGWNYVTDMYRIMEYAASDLQRSRSGVLKTPAIQALNKSNSHSQSDLLDRITAMYHDLPAVFKTTAPPTDDARQNLYSFQAANIAATVQLVRMVYFSSDASNLEQKCRTASEVLTAFASMPVAYLRAISSPLLHHLAEIGRIFGAAFGAGMSASLYHSVRSVLLDLTTFLVDLEQKLCCPIDASKKVEAQIMRIDRFMREQHQVSNGLPSTTPTIQESHPAPILETGLLSFADAAMEQQAMDINFPPELFEDWSGAFAFT